MLDISPKFHYKSFALPWAGLYPFVIVFYCNLPFMHAVAMDRILLVAVALCLLFFGPAGTNGGRFRPLKDQADPSPSVNESYSIRQLIDHVSPLADNQSGAPVTYVSFLFVFICLFRCLLCQNWWHFCCITYVVRSAWDRTGSTRWLLRVHRDNGRLWLVAESWTTQPGLVLDGQCRRW